MMSYNYLDPADVGKIERPTEEQLRAEGYEGFHTDEWKAELRKINTGKNNAMFGRTQSAAARQKMSDNHWSKNGKVPWNKGIPQDVETKKKNSEAMKRLWAQGKLKGRWS